MTRAVLLASAFVVAATSSPSAENPREAFVRAWEGRAVTVQAPIYTLVFNERGKLGKTTYGRREGLTIATASGAAYLQFDGRQGRETVVQQDPRQMLAAVNTAYDPDVLDVRAYRRLEALRVSRYDPGARLAVTAVRFARDEVHVELAAAGRPDTVTRLRVKWPTLLSPAFEEREAIEGVIQHFVSPTGDPTPARLSQARDR
jgi:hypothetical protein